MATRERHASWEVIYEKIACIAAIAMLINCFV
jgi:hypothetical protein